MNKYNAQYMVSLSFAGEDREYVNKVAKGLKSSGVSVFYDSYEVATLWGKDLYEHLTDVYQNRSRFVIIFISEHYDRKLWTSHEKKMAQARAFRESGEYILPVRFDDTVIPSIPDTIGYLDAREFKPADIVEFTKQKLIDAGVSLTKQQSLANGELIETSTKLIEKLRESVATHEIQTENLKRPIAKSNVDFAKEWEAHTMKRAKLDKWLMVSFKNSFQSEAILLKNELIQRLNLSDRDKFKDILYENPVNLHGLVEVISDLEQLTLMLEE